MENKMFNWTKPEGKIFVGCMFLGIGIGILFEKTVAGTMVGMGIGFIAVSIYSKSKNN